VRTRKLRCSICKQIKPEGDFALRSATARGRVYDCKQCRVELGTNRAKVEQAIPPDDVFPMVTYLILAPEEATRTPDQMGISVSIFPPYPSKVRQP
jgi:hypothetical protein